MSIKPIAVVFSPEGQEKVTQAMESILQAAKRLEKAQISGIKAVNKEQIKSNKDTHAQKMKFLKEELKVQQEFAKATSKRGSDKGFSSGGAGRGGGESLLGARGGGSGGALGGLGKMGLAGAAFSIGKKIIDSIVDSLKQFAAYIIDDVIKPAWKLETQAQQASNASGGTIKTPEIVSGVGAMNLKHNIGKDELMESFAKFQDKTGDSKQALKMLDTTAMLAKSYGADIGQLTGMVIAIKGLAAAQGKDLSTKELSDLLLVQLAQGNANGAQVTLKETSGLGGEYTANAGMLAGNTDVKMAIMGALTQTSFGKFKNVDTQSTGIGNFLKKLAYDDSDATKRFRTSDGKIADVSTAIATMVSEAGGDLSKIKDKYKLDEGSTTFLSQYTDQYNAAGGGAAGKAAITNSIGKYATIQGGTMEQERAKEKSVLDTPGEKIDRAMNIINAAILKLKPVFDTMADMFLDVAPQIGTLGTIVGAIIAALGFLIAGLLWVPLKIGQVIGKAVDWIEDKLKIGKKMPKEGIHNRFGSAVPINSEGQTAEEAGETPTPKDGDLTALAAQMSAGGPQIPGAPQLAAKTDAQIQAEAPKGAVRRILTESQAPIGPPTADGALPTLPDATTSTGTSAPAAPVATPAEAATQKLSELAAELGKIIASAKGLEKTFDDLAAAGDAVARNTPVSDR